MATFDAVANTVDVTIAVVGASRLSFLIAIGEPKGLPRQFIEADPSVALAMPSKGDAPKTILHLSAYDSDLARADAVIVAGERAPDEEPPPASAVTADGEPFDAVKRAARTVLDQLGSAVLLPMPHEVREGLHRHDRSATPALAPDGAPTIGRHVKLQVNLREEGWLAMGGQVTAVIGPDAVEARVVATTDGAPAAFDGSFVARLERRPGWQFPWMLTSLSRA